MKNLHRIDVYDDDELDALPPMERIKRKPKVEVEALPPKKKSKKNNKMARELKEFRTPDDEQDHINGR